MPKNLYLFTKLLHQTLYHGYVYVWLIVFNVFDVGGIDGQIEMQNILFMTDVRQTLTHDNNK